MAKITMYKNVLNQNKSIIYDKTVTQSIWPRRLKTSSWCDSTCLNFLNFWNKLFYKKIRIIITINFYFSIFGNNPKCNHVGPITPILGANYR